MPSILVIEQEDRSIRRISEALAAGGWKVRVASGHAEALAAASSEAPDLVLVNAGLPGSDAVAGSFGRAAGGPGVVALVPEGAGPAAVPVLADEVLAGPFADEDLRLLVQRSLAHRRSAPPPRPPAEHKLTSRDIFGDMLAEVESEVAGTAAPAAAPAPRPPARDDRQDVERRLEQTLSGVIGQGPRPAGKPRPLQPAPARKAAERDDSDVDALLNKTLSKLELGAPGRPAAPKAPAQPPAAAAPAAPAASRPAAVEGTGVRKPAARPAGDLDFSELDALARSARRPEPARPAAQGAPPPAAVPRPAAPVPPAAAPARPAPPAPEPPRPPAAPPPPAPPIPPAAPQQPEPALTQRIPIFAEGQQPGERFGQYLLEEKIAAGGMAEVWKARMTGVEGFQKTVAIKKILPHLTDNAEFVGMFIDEAKLAAQLNHPNIIHIYDLGKLGRDYYIAMEYVEGKDLRSILNAARRRGQHLPTGLALLIAARLAAALDYAHRKRDFDQRELGLVHRDVSPQNVLLTVEGDIKLCDFGIAKAVSKASQTQLGALKGKLQYMSPEQAWGRAVDARSDLFSLGAILFEMLTGERLFPGDSEISVLEAVREGRTRSPREVAPEVPAEVDEIVTRALARDPEARFQSAGELQQRLEAVLQTLRPTPGPADLAVWMQRLFAPEEPPAPAPDRLPAQAPAAVPAATWTPAPELPPSEPAPVVPAVEPLGEVRMEGEEGGGRGRKLLIAAILALVILGALTYLFFGRRGEGGGPQPPETPAAEAPGGAAQGAPPQEAQGTEGLATAVPAPSAAAAAAPSATPASSAPGVDVAGIVDKELAKREQELRRKLEEEQRRLERELALAKAAGKPARPAPASAPPVAPAPDPAVQRPEPAAQAAEVPLQAAPPPPPEPEPERSEPAREPAPAPAPREPAVRVGELIQQGPGVVPPELVTAPKPEYPPLARRLRVEGNVVVSVLVDEDGRVQDVRLVEPIKQNVGINEAAVQAARAARYRPATKEGVRVKMWTRLRIPFKQ